MLIGGCELVETFDLKPASCDRDGAVGLGTSSCKRACPGSRNDDEAETFDEGAGCETREG